MQSPRRRSHSPDHRRSYRDYDRTRKRSRSPGYHRCSIQTYSLIGWEPERVTFMQFLAEIIQFRSLHLTFVRLFAKLLVKFSLFIFQSSPEEQTLTVAPDNIAGICRLATWLTSSTGSVKSWPQSMRVLIHRGSVIQKVDNFNLSKKPFF